MLSSTAQFAHVRSFACRGRLRNSLADQNCKSGRVSGRVRAYVCQNVSGVFGPASKFLAKTDTCWHAIIVDANELIRFQSPLVWKAAKAQNAGPRYIRGWCTIYSYFTSNANR